jgi:hypothetical protein
MFISLKLAKQSPARLSLCFMGWAGTLPERLVTLMDGKKPQIRILLSPLFLSR